MKVPMTTIMLRNVPHKYNQDTLFNEVMAVLDGKLDVNFLYLPWDQRQETNAGFAFINCCDPDGAARCKELFDGYYFQKSARRTACTVFMAHIQGLESNLIHLLSTSAGNLGKHCPFVIWQGHRLTFGRIVAAMRAMPDPPQRVRPLLGPSSEPSGRAPAPPLQPDLTGYNALRRCQELAMAASGQTQQGFAPSTVSTQAPLSSGCAVHSQEAAHGAGSRPEASLESGADVGHLGGGGFSRSAAEASLAQRVRNLMAEKGIPMPAAGAGAGRRDVWVMDKIEVDLGALFASSHTAAGRSTLFTGDGQANTIFTRVAEQSNGVGAQGFAASKSTSFATVVEPSRSVIAGHQEITSARLPGVAEPARMFSARDAAVTPVGHHGEGIATLNVSQKALHDRLYQKFLQRCGEEPDSSANVGKVSDLAVATMATSSHPVRAGFYFEL